jgi:hypothetical protein
LVALLSAATSAFAQTGQLSVTINGFTAQDWSRGQAVVTVLGGDGRPVAGLTQQDFQTQVDGSNVPVTKVSRAVDSNLPTAVVLALDVSVSMQGAPLDQAKLGAHRFIDGLGSNDTVAVVAFSDGANIVQPFTQDHAAAGAAIDGLVAAGGSALYDATTKSVLQAAASANTGRRAIVLLSTSADSGNAGSRQQSLVAAKGLGVPAYVIALGAAVDEAYLRELTDAGGGQLMQTPTPDGLVQLYQNVSDLIRDQYVLTVDASALGLNTTDATTLHVSVNNGSASGSGERAVCPGKVCASYRGLKAGAQFKGTQTIVADVISAGKVNSVSLLIDGTPVQTVKEAPYQFSIDPKAFKAGDHTLALSVETSSGSAQLGELSVQLGGKAGGFSVSLIAIAAFILLGVVALFAVIYVVRRRKGQSGSPQPSPPAPESRAPVPISINKKRRGRSSPDDAAPPAPAEAEPALGYLHGTTGPLAGRSFAVGAKPVSIGSGHRCRIRLPEEIDGYEVASESVRVWIRGRQLMVHEVRRLTAMGSTGGQWEILAERDTFAIGPCVFSFALDDEPVAPPEPVPNVLRDKPSPPAATVPAAPTSEPVTNIFRDSTDDKRTDAGEPPIEQATGG